MDPEAMQLLNLSPIPELSELELSTMLDHLSGLSDVNGDLTDRNVEDILKEAEELLDKSISSQIHESKDGWNNPATEENKIILKEGVEVSDDNKEQMFQDFEFTENKHCNTSIHSDHTLPENSSNKDDTEKKLNSFEHTPTKITSPGNSSNHIRSTIESLKEFSTLIEKKFGNQSPKSSPPLTKEVKQNTTQQDKKITIMDSKLKEKLINVKPICNSTKIGKSNLPAKKNIPDPLAKSIKLLNCFERLYQDHPVRLTADKTKLTKGLKNNKKNMWPEKNVLHNKTTTKVSPRINSFTAKTHPDGEHAFKQSKRCLKDCFSDNENCILQMKIMENETKGELLKNKFGDGDFPRDGLKIIQSRVEEKLMLKAIGGRGEEIKDTTGNFDVINGNINSNNIKLNLIEIDKPVSSLESEEEKFLSTSEKNFGIKRLEEQFSSLKEKYEYQMAKLEAENFKLREALNSQQKGLTLQMITNSEISNITDVENTIQAKNSKTLIFSSPSSCTTDNNILQNVSEENFKVPKNSPCSSLENEQSLKTLKEAFSQTEKEVKSRSIQCCQEYKETGTDPEMTSEARVMENKENVSSKKKLGKSKPFSDINVHQMLRQKKILDHESQLLATLRGLQSEVNLKDKENKKLRIEIDSLRKQTKKSTVFKAESCKKCHIGTQTIGLVSLSQKAYNPEKYEVPQEFEKENEELRSRIIVLEEDFELLKKKRINDLQSLHQVHEEEMAKLVSKLETQSALTKHLHSLLINR